MRSLSLRSTTAWKIDIIQYKEMFSKLRLYSSWQKCVWESVGIKFFIFADCNLSKHIFVLVDLSLEKRWVPYTQYKLIPVLEQFSW